MSGLGSTGFAIKRQPEIVAEIETDQKTVFGAGLELDPSSPDAQFNGLMSDQLAAIWELGLALYSGLDPRTAGGVMLERVSAIAGILRQQAVPSTATVQLFGTVGTVIPAGTIYSAPSIPNVKFIMDAEVVLDSLGYALGEVTSDTEGAILVAASTITKIETPVTGLSTVTNPSPGNTGIDRETDEELRRRRAESVGLASTSMVEAIRSNIANTVGVERTKIYENTDVVPDANGIPAHTIATYVQGGQDSDVAEAIALKRSGGCGLFGSTTSSFTDTNGFTHDIKFSRPTDIPIFIKITASKATSWDVNANDRIKTAVVDYANGESDACDDFLGYDISEDVYGTQLIHGLMGETSIRIQSVLVGTSSPAGDQVQAIGFDELASFITTNVEIVYV